ncbi:hypothetical protein M231_06391 [Tremella mesenterica]|uniref:Nicotinamide-nucleotide adenylyltransferase n=1 Tax=Tremella mesenterica TaxID=5217 RepID=A0A4Q1BEA6_TREME|nr:hypothetical protein M231_06391 [Tremella mesenterica]
MSRFSRKQLTELLHTSSSSSTPFTLIHAPPQWPHPPNASTSKVHISILDSSFNPPTTAHLALICAPFPPITDISNPSPTIPKSPDHSQIPTKRNDEYPDIEEDVKMNDTYHENGYSIRVEERGKEDRQKGDYTTRLLLLSLKNVDKTPSSTDATPQQRIEMMVLLSKEVEKKTGQSCAVGICHEATFVGKNKVIREYLSSISTRSKTPSSNLSLGVESSSVNTSNGNYDVGQGTTKKGQSGSPTATDYDNIVHDVGHETVQRDQSRLQNLHQGGILENAQEGYKNGGMGEKIDLTFLIGTDTLTRFFSPKYYPEKQMMPLLKEFFKSTTLVSALRNSTASVTHPIGTPKNIDDEDEDDKGDDNGRDKKEDIKKSVEITLLESEVVRPWTLSGKVRLLDLGEETEGVSSTSVRKQVKDKLRHKSVDGDERKTQRSTKEDMVGTYMLVDADEGEGQVVVEDGREDGADERREQVVVEYGREEDMIKGVLNTIKEYIKIEGLYI